MMNKSSKINVFFNPKTVAIIGASEKPKFGIGTTTYLLNSKFKTYPVNLNSDTIFGHKAYRNVKNIPDDIDLAIIIVSNRFVLQAVKDCIEKNIKGIIIESTYLNTEQRQPEFNLARNKNAEVMFIEIICPEEIASIDISN